MQILAIETSCDETSVAVLEVDKQIRIINNLVASQMDMHAKYGGVVPEVAARMHTETIIPVLEEATQDINPQNIDLIAVTYGPGLITSLLVGIETAKALGVAWKKPVIGVNHLAGHLYSPWLESKQLKLGQEDIFPAVSLIVSGGHTQLMLLKNYTDYKLLGSTRDDAVGEAFDKVAKMMDLSYPGGPEISKRALNGNPKSIDFPRPMIDSDNLDFSFSGLKTAVRYYIEEHPNLSASHIDDICASFQAAAIDVLIHKTRQAIEKYDAQSVLLGGGVSANRDLRKELLILADRQEIKFACPKLEYTGDNAAMIGLAGYFKTQQQPDKVSLDNWQQVAPDPNAQL